MKTFFCSSAFLLLLANTANSQDFTRGLRTKISKFAKTKAMEHSHEATKAFGAKAAKDVMSMEFVWAGKSEERGSKATKISLLVSEEMSMGAEVSFIHKNIFEMETDVTATTALSMEFVPMGSKSTKAAPKIEIGQESTAPQATETEMPDLSMVYIQVSAKNSKNIPYKANEVDTVAETSADSASSDSSSDAILETIASKSAKDLTTKSSKSSPIVLSPRSISFSAETDREVSEANESNVSGADATSNTKMSAAAVAVTGAMLIL